MPGLRHYLEIDYGVCFGEDWDRVFMPKRRNRKSVRSAGGPESGSESPQGPATGEGRASSGTHSYSAVEVQYRQGSTGQDSHSSANLELDDPFRDPDPAQDFDWEVDDDGGYSDGTEYMTRTERRAWRTIEKMRTDDTWRGTNYQLLGR